MSENEIHELVAEILLASSPQDEINALIVSMLEMNEIGFNKIIDRAIAKNGLLKTTTDLLYPFLNHVGVLWGTNKAMPAQEHFISNLIKQKLFNAIDDISPKDESHPTLVLFLVEGENHEIGLLLANYIAKELGWRTIYLGQNVPLENIKEVIEITNPVLMMTLFTMPKIEAIVHHIESIIKETKVSLVVSGPNAVSTQLQQFDQVDFVENPEVFIEILQNKRNATIPVPTN